MTLKHTKTSMPPCARRFFLNIVMPSVSQDRGSRNVREIEVLAHVADLLATNNIAAAADIVTQRMVACRMAEEDQNWKSAHFVELVPLDSINMVPKPMRLMAKKQAEQEKRNSKSSSSDNAWPEQDWKKAKDWGKQGGKSKDWSKGGKPWYLKGGKPWGKDWSKDGGKDWGKTYGKGQGKYQKK